MLQPKRIELIRIQRALYRIETWYILFRRFRRIHINAARDTILLSLPVWELDELGCVYDYLMTRATKIIEAVGEAQLDGEDEYYRLLFFGGSST